MMVHVVAVGSVVAVSVGAISTVLVRVGVSVFSAVDVAGGVLAAWVAVGGTRVSVGSTAVVVEEGWGGVAVGVSEDVGVGVSVVGGTGVLVGLVGGVFVAVVVLVEV